VVDVVSKFMPQIVAVVTVVVAVLSTGHVVLHKRSSSAAIGWVGLIWLVPLVGAVLYVGFGINRIRRRARKLGRRQREARATRAGIEPSPEQAAWSSRSPHLAPLARVTNLVVRMPLASGNRVGLLINGDEAFPAMLDAIRGAQRSITLVTYIFDADHAGHEFRLALIQAHERGVAVRVLVDDVGSRYARPPMPRLLRRAGVPVASWMPTSFGRRFAYMNLRNHRKILVVDGRVGFVGGMNIREGNLLRSSPRHAIQDLHAQVEGPVVRQLQAIFAEDWQFATREILDGPLWFPSLDDVGPVIARVVADGPDEDYEVLQKTLLGALATAQHTVRVLTPYFLPDDALQGALDIAALRGVDVRIVLPEKNNLALVQWASAAVIGPLMERGCRFWLSPGPFDHAKAMIVDGAWTLLGSGNWDPRSLRLNFEVNLECWDSALAAAVDRLIDDRMARGRELFRDDLDGRPLLVKLRDGVAHLAAPYL
jgi:cardiolipin synthase